MIVCVQIASRVGLALRAENVSFWMPSASRFASRPGPGRDSYQSGSCVRWFFGKPSGLQEGLGQQEGLVSKVLLARRFGF
jgi:hypothetical protein